jgi:hypothetical protein
MHKLKCRLDIAVVILRFVREMSKDKKDYIASLVSDEIYAPAV